MRQIKGRRKLIGGALAAAMAVTIALPGAAFATGGGSSAKDMGASWSVPTAPMTNTVEKDGKTYKVVTTWAMAWSTSGPDFLGVNNSSFYGNGGNGNANVTSTEVGATQTLLGVWASEANESPNAFNWNSFYNLYADEQATAGTKLDKTDLACTSASWDTSSGVYGPFKYRPEIIWLCNNLSAAQTAEYVGYINNGKYVASEDQIQSHTTGQGQQQTTVIDSIADPTADQKKQFYVDGDEKYDPYVIQPVNDNAYAFVESGYELAGLVDKVIADTADNKQLSASEINWKTMNSLPRATRYNESAQECALNIERLARGSAYYTLSKIADGTVARKKVAYVSYGPNATSTDRSGNVTQHTDATHAVIVVMDYMENIGGMGLNGSASWSPLVVDQLGQDGKLDVYNNADHTVLAGAGPSTGSNTEIVRPTTTYSYYLATADDLLSCDVIYEGRDTSYSVADMREWLASNATTADAKAKAKSISIIAGFPYVCNGSNYTMDKLIYGAYALDTIYPELFPNMENSTYWYNKVYHIKNAMLGSAMTWAYAAATLPASQKLPSAEEGSAYKAEDTVAKYDAGLAYYNNNKTKDATLVRILASKALDGSTEKDGTAYSYTNFEPTNAWVQAANPAEITVKNVKKAYGDKAFTLSVSTPSKGEVTYSSDNTKVATVNSKGKVTIKGVGKAQITVNVAASGNYGAGSATATVTVSKGAQPMTVKAKKATIKAGKSVKASKVFTVKKNQGKVTYKKKSGNKKITVSSAGKITVKKGLKKGNYTIKVKATAKGNAKYKSGSKTVSVKVKVK